MVIGGKGLKYVGILRYVAVRGVAVLFGTRQRQKTCGALSLSCCCKALLVLVVWFQRWFYLLSSEIL